LIRVRSEVNSITSHPWEVEPRLLRSWRATKNWFGESFEDWTRDPNNNLDTDIPDANPNFTNKKKISGGSL
jgi:hypothetical protein